MAHINSFSITLMSIFVVNQIRRIGAAEQDLAETAAAPRSSFENQLAARQLLGVDLRCGLNLNTFGQVAPLKASGEANLCLQCRFNAFGLISLDFSFLNSLTSSISAHGVSARDAAILQGHLQDELNAKAAQQKSRAQCDAAFSNDKRCAYSNYANGQCRAAAIDCVKNNRNGPVLAKAFGALFRKGGPSYCAICCNALSFFFFFFGRDQRGTKRALVPARKRGAACPIRRPSLSRAVRAVSRVACPISETSEFTPSTPYECLDTQQELTSCGGCVTLGNGTNCATLRGAGMSGCSNGKCTIFSCARGFKFSKRDQACHRVHSQQHVSSRSHFSR
ncbi:hypothetical protein VP01_1568g2 [Puccinia sorghi]|uniref:Protein CPL1-like domain-containing protein n=1 Tax=Puccinia sorghi TaxID=27349 RepID=A0A0L6VI19_9BASI|nr:hypothetical protein VP01_1568g2 [Puccinia sorghi]